MCVNALWVPAVLVVGFLLGCVFMSLLAAAGKGV